MSDALTSKQKAERLRFLASLFDCGRGLHGQEETEIEDALEEYATLLEQPPEAFHLSITGNVYHRGPSLGCEQCAPPEATGIDVAEMNRKLCDSEGHAWSNMPVNFCFRCHIMRAAHEPGELREALRIYGGHIPNCPGRPCECGFQQAWERSGLPQTKGDSRG